MNLIFIVTDTLRADFIGAYGNDWVSTPNIDAFARRSVQFNCCHGEGLPTIPARRVLMTGASVLPFADVPPYKGHSPRLPGWRALSEDDVSLADLLRDRGYTNGLVADLWHLFKPNMNFHRNFHTWEFIRGQENDPWRLGAPGKHDIRDHLPEHMVDEELAERLLVPYLDNTDWFASEEDYFCARTMRAASQWLENGRRRQPFFLYVDTFDPHEIFDAPRRYADMYCDDYPCERPIYGYGVKKGSVREEDAEWIKGLYAAKITMLDTWFGHLTDSIERLGLLEDTVICFTSDHGTEFFEHGEICKSAHQIYENVTRMPLLIRAPGAESHAGRQIDALASAVDIAPTLLGRMGQAPPDTMTGVDLWPLVTGEIQEARDHAIIGYSRSGAVRTREWLLHTYAEPNHRYKGSEIEITPALFDLKNDPEEKTDVLAGNPDTREALLAMARRVWRCAS